LFPVRILNYPYDISTVFPARAGDHTPLPAPSLSRVDGGIPGNMLDSLCVVDYRYSRFALDPRTGLFSMIRSGNIIFCLFFNRSSTSRDWRDRSWTGRHSVQNGLDQSIRTQRLTLFGSNEIDIEGKSTLALLVDEVSSLPIVTKELVFNSGLDHSPVLCIPNS
jgi:cation-transporting P-type ATPase 13A2